MNSLTNARPEDLQEATARLASVVLAKEFFLTDWFMEVCRRLLPEGDASEMAHIQLETRDEVQRVEALAGEIMKAIGSEAAREEPEEVRHVGRRDFLRALIELKVSTGEAVEGTARLAPSPWLRDAFLEAAAVDFRHATRLREMLAHAAAEEEPADEAF